MGSVYKRGKKRWWGSWIGLDGKQKRKPLANSRRDAERILREIERRIDFQRYELPIQESISVRKLWDMFGKSKKETVRPRTWETWLPRLEYWKEKHIKRGEVFKPFAFIEIQQIIQEELMHDLANKTINDYISVLRQVYEYARKMNVIKLNPVKDIERLTEKPTRVPRAFSRTEFDKIIHEANDFYKDLFTFLAYTGLRRNEARFLKWKDIDFNNEEIRIGMREGFTTKSKKGRVIPMHPKVKDILNRRKKSQEYIFGHKGQPYGADTWRHVLRKITDKLSIENCSLHTFRHTFATWLANAEANPFYVKELLGHSDIKTTLKYFHSTPDYKRKAIFKLK